MAGARLAQGWRNLVSEYHLQMGDICIFELIQPTHELVFHLHTQSIFIPVVETFRLPNLTVIIFFFLFSPKDSMDNDRASQSQRKRKNPSFFKVLIEDFSTRLKIPSDFNKVLDKEVPKKAILETYYGKSEEVEVEKHENRFCFCKGWSKFVENNKLESEDLLVFKYLSDCSKFKVKIYGKTCCEKEHYYPSETGKNEDERDGRKRKREEKEQDNNVKEDGTFKTAKRIETDSDSDFGDEASEDEPINLDSDTDTDSTTSHPIVEEEIGNSRQPSSEEKENEEPQSLHSDNQTEFEHEGPSFQVELQHTSITSYLNIPLEFARKHLKESPKKQQITVTTHYEKEWDLRLLVSWGDVDKKNEIIVARLTKGWKNLVSEYNLVIGDFCDFELIQPTNGLVFHLHVFRNVAENEDIRIL
ncbi:hypothetical protein K1719_022860 [Acacia pycnantha]|nr:hypothetical protein K1719_022860 [Acacia pycnantha]